jgi:hypothetical protein
MDGSCGGQETGQIPAMTSISTSAPLGRAETSTQLRAGLPVKYFFIGNSPIKIVFQN